MKLRLILDATDGETTIPVTITEVSGVGDVLCLLAELRRRLPAPEPSFASALQQQQAAAMQNVGGIGASLGGLGL